MNAEGNMHVIECPWSDIGVTVVLMLGTKNLLIDAGTLDSPQRAILPYLKTIGNPTIHLTALLHGHVDHAGGCHVIKELTGSRLLAHRDSYKIMSDRTFGFEWLFTPYMPYLDQAVARDFAEMYRRCWDIPCQADIILKEGDVIDLGPTKLEVIETPGHEEGSICLYDDDSKTLFTGDAVQGLGVNSKAEPTIPLYRDLNAYVTSLRKMLTLKVDRLVTSHPFKPQSSGIVVGDQAAEMIRSSIQATQQVENAIMTILKNSKQAIDLGRLAEEVVRRMAGAALTAVDLWTIDAHVCSLSKTRKVRVFHEDSRKFITLP